MGECGVVLGIDLGTSFSSAAAVVGGRIEPVLDGGEAQVPSIVYVPPRGDLIVGREAQRLGLGDPLATITMTKRLLGRAFDDPGIRGLRHGAAFALRATATGETMVHVRDHDFSPTQFAAAILERLRRLAERRFGGPIKRCVITVPVVLSPGYLEALHRAAILAGLEVIQWLSEPVAGALALGLAPRGGSRKRRVLLCDFGGGTFDASLLELDGPRLTPVATAGDDWLGGDDFDQVLADAIAHSAFLTTRTDLRRDQVQWSQLLWRCESAKRQLSTHVEARLRMKEALIVNRQYQDLDVLIDRPYIEPRWRPLVERAVTVIDGLVARAGWNTHPIDELMLIGGTSRVPLVRRALAALAGKETQTTFGDELAVVTGAAQVAAQLTGRELAAARAELVA